MLIHNEGVELAAPAVLFVDTVTAKVLAELVPQLEYAYQQINLFRNWYEPNKIKDKTWNLLIAESKLINWIYNTETSSINKIQNFRNTIENHEQCILNYHLNYKTNANS